MGCYESSLPLSSLPGSEITTDTLLLAESASFFSPSVCFDLGTGTGEVLKNTSFSKSLLVGIDISFESLKQFDKSVGQPVLCSVKQIKYVFKENCAELVLANPPYFDNTVDRSSPDRYRQQTRAGDALLLYRFIFAAAYLLKLGGSFLISGRSSDSAKIEQGLRAAGFNSIVRKESGKIVVIQSIFQP